MEMHSLGFVAGAHAEGECVDLLHQVAEAVILCFCANPQQNLLVQVLCRVMKAAVLQWHAIPEKEVASCH